MRTLGFRTHVLLAVAGAIGILYSLSRPWYALAPAASKEDDAGIGDIHGPLNSFFDGVRRTASGGNGVTGWQALDHWAQIIAAATGMAVVGALLCLASPALQSIGRDLARYGSFAALAIIAWKVIDPPGSNAAWELRVGALLAGLFSVVLFTCASGVANAPARRKVPQRKFTPPPPPPAYESV